MRVPTREGRKSRERIDQLVPTSEESESESDVMAIASEKRYSANSPFMIGSDGVESDRTKRERESDVDRLSLSCSSQA